MQSMQSLQSVGNANGFSEKEAALIMKKLFLAINHCHCQGVSHRDIKAENIMFSDKEQKNIKIIDFGLSKLSEEKGCFMDTLVGTPMYLAPEVLDGLYGKECDIWSLGVIMHLLLSGLYPFSGENSSKLFNNIKTAKVDMEGEAWIGVSDSAKRLLEKIFTKNQKERITAEQALKDGWFKEIFKGKEGHHTLNTSIINKLREYRAKTAFQKATMNMLVKRLGETDLEYLRKSFKKLDKSNTGQISFECLEQHLLEQGFEIPSKEIKEIINRVDYKGNNLINYSEFLSATISSKKFLTEERLWSLFKHFDSDNTDFITVGNLKDVLAQEGKEINEDEAEAIIEEHDTLKDGRLNFDEFKIILKYLLEVEKTNNAVRVQDIIQNDTVYFDIVQENHCPKTIDFMGYKILLINPTADNMEKCNNKYIQILQYEANKKTKKLELSYRLINNDHMNSVNVICNPCRSFF